MIAFGPRSPLMSSCATIDPLVTPYVDGELGPPDREHVERHLRVCVSCADRVSSERAVADLCRVRRAELRARAPEMLVGRCAVALGSASDRAPQARWWPRRALALGAAATVLLAVMWFTTVSSSQAIAAELAVDHVKCLLLNAVLGTRDSETHVRATVRRRFDWDVQLPAHPEQAGLTLVGTRPCLYQHGTIAHIMYRHKGVLASLYMLPGVQQPEHSRRALGHEAVVWSNGDRTFVVVERGERADVEHVASVLRTALDAGAQGRGDR